MKKTLLVLVAIIGMSRALSARPPKLFQPASTEELKKMTAQEISELPSPKIQAITAAQMGELNPKQLEALESALAKLVAEQEKEIEEGKSTDVQHSPWKGKPVDVRKPAEKPLKGKPVDVRPPNNHKS